jgi:hypothetical protein
MSAIEPIGDGVRPVEPVRRPVRRDPDREREQQPEQEPRERKQREQDEPSGGGGLVDVRV